MRTRLVVGCMSGTSMDGLDAALVEVAGCGLAMTARLRTAASADYPEALRVALRRLGTAGGPAVTPRELCGYLEELNGLHESTIRAALRGAQPDLIAVHGQTIHHAPPQSWQLAAPAGLARRLRAALVYDLRAADLAAGGEGAPITPLADFILLRDATERRVVVNLGGFANYTFLPAVPPGASLTDATAGIRGGDICLCNQLLDALAQARLECPMDVGGAAAASGRTDRRALAALRERLNQQARAGRSLGSGDQPLESLTALLAGLGPNDALRTACDAIGATVADALPECERLLLAGGGARNVALAGAIAAAGRAKITAATDGHGLPIEYREAICMAVLGALCADRVPITLPQITGVAAPAPVAGTWILPDVVDPAHVFRAAQA